MKARGLKMDSTDRPERYAVTGAGGFIGHAMAKHLLNAGHEVVAIVRNDAHGVELAERGAVIKVVDVRVPGEVCDALRGVSGVFHFAALFNAPECSWSDYRATNVTGTLNVLKAAKDNGVGRVVYSSTVGVATEARPPPYTEDVPYSPQPNDKYEVTKTEAEQAAMRFSRENGFDLVVIRPAQVYGPGDVSKAKFYRLVKRGIIVSPGKTKKHLVYIDDLCKAFDLAMVNPVAGGDVFLIADNSPVDLREMIEIVANVLDVPYPRIQLPAWPITLCCATVEAVSSIIGIKPFVFKRSMDFFTRTVECDITKARKVLGFEHRTQLHHGIWKTVEFYRRKKLLT